MSETSITQLPNDPIYKLPPIELIPETIVFGYDLAESRDWGHVPLGLEALHDQGYVGENVVVAICDTGIDDVHPDLTGKVLASRDFTGGNNPNDRQGHGTHCAGIACAANNGNGLIGAAPAARLVRAKVLSDEGSGASSWIAAGMKWAADNGADIISLSLGGPQQDPYTSEALDYCIAKGCWVVAAAGNDGRPATSFPGHLPKMIAVAAIGKDGRRAPFSTQNAQNDVATPGVSIMSTLPGGRYGQMSGTSMATPYVAGCLALVRGAVKKAGVPMPSQAEVLAAIKSTSSDIAPTGPDADTGAGLLNTAALIARFVGSAPPTPPTDPPTTPNPPIMLPNAGGISFQRNVPWKKDGNRWITSGTYSMSVTALSPADAPPPDLEPILGTIFVPRQPVEAWGIRLPGVGVPAHTLQTGGDVANTPNAIDWQTILRQLCAYAPNLPQPFNHAAQLVCWLLQSQAPRNAATGDIIKLICQYRQFFPEPVKSILALVCRFYPAQTGPCSGC